MSEFGSSWGNYLLKEIVETSAPDAISWWPSTLGWKFVALIALFYLIKKIIKTVQKYRYNIYRRQAIKWLDNLPSSHDENSDPIFRQIPALVRLAALNASSREEVTGLNKECWDQWLDKQCKVSRFSSKFPQYLHQLAYSPHFTISSGEMSEFIGEIAVWIKQHRNQYD
jgi:hypothetical protein